MSNEHRDNATIAEAAFPHWFGCLTGTNASMAVKIEEIAMMACEARRYGWLVIDGKAYLPSERQEMFRTAVGLE